MKETELFDKIEAYLKGKMPPEASEAFAREIARDPDLQEAVDLHRLGFEALDVLDEEVLRQKMKKWDALPPTDETPPEQSSGSRSWIWIGLGILAALVAAFWFFRPSPVSTPPPAEIQKPNSNLPVAETPATTPEPAPATPPSPAPDKQDSPAQFAALSKKRYAESRSNWETNIRSDRKDPLDSLFAQPKQLMRDGYPQQALRLLDQIRTDNDPVAADFGRKLKAHASYQAGKYILAADIFRAYTLKESTRDEAQWYLLLCLVADYPNRKSQADQVLKEILQQNFPNDPANNHPFLTQAQELKSDLDKIRR